MVQEVKYVKKILCLANSRKMSGRCLAGREIAGVKVGSWVRPVSKREHEEISEDDRRYEDGHTASLLDIISIPMLKPKPHLYQTENHLISDEHYWRKTAGASWEQIEKCVDRIAGPLWVNGSAAFGAVNDRVTEAQASKITSSLYLIKPTDLKIVVAPQGGMYAPEKRRVRAQFKLNGADYKIQLTDAVMERRYLQGQNGIYSVPKGLLCVSLGESYKGHAYKLAAALITPDRVGKSND